MDVCSAYMRDLTIHILKGVADEYEINHEELLERYMGQPPKKTKKSLNKKKVTPVHNHPPTLLHVDGCGLCSSHGNFLDPNSTKCQFIVSF